MEQKDNESVFSKVKCSDGMPVMEKMLKFKLATNQNLPWSRAHETGMMCV